jgi:glutamate/tyrosine decarboxylase-like PLP-dependent enzyme
MLPDSAYQVIHDELLLDGNARQNLATFVTTWMEPQAAVHASVTFLDGLSAPIPRPEGPATPFHH